MLAITMMGLSLASYLIVYLVLPPSQIRMTVSCGEKTSQVVRPVWTRTNVWDLSYAPSEAPTPFIREVILMTATGGRETCEMFHLDPSGTPVHNFSKIDLALDRILSAGLEPIIVLGNVPEELSDLPGEKGAFDANIGAPKNYDKYYEYIQALFAHLAERYGQDVVEAWGYRLMTEPDNKDWWKHGRLEYQKLYDYTVAAARSAAPGVVIDGGNLMTPVGKDVWTPFWAHWIASGSNPLLSAAIPRKVNRVGFSCYARGQMEMDPTELGRMTEEIRKESSELGEFMISVDEGQILHDEDGKYLWLGDGTELGAAWNAAIFKVCLDHDIERYVQWGFLTDGVKSPSYNVITMYEKMLENPQVSTRIKGGRLPKNSYLDALATSDEEGNIRILAFHYNPDRNLYSNQDVKLVIRDVEKGSYDVSHWRVDKDHSNFFTEWLEDSKDLFRMDTGSNSGSIWDLAATGVLGRQGWELWNSKKPHYLEIDDLESLEPTETLEIEGEFSKRISLPVNSVSLIELVRNPA